MGVCISRAMRPSTRPFERGPSNSVVYETGCDLPWTIDAALPAKLRYSSAKGEQAEHPPHAHGTQALHFASRQGTTAQAKEEDMASPRPPHPVREARPVRGGVRRGVRRGRRRARPQRTPRCPPPPASNRSNRSNQRKQ
jgi:hypothetical protein